MAAAIAAITLYVQFFRVDNSLFMHVMAPSILMKHFSQAPDTLGFEDGVPGTAFIKLRVLIHNEGTRPSTLAEIKFIFASDSSRKGPGFTYPVRFADGKPELPLVITPGQTQLAEILVPMHANTRSIIKQLGGKYKTLPSGQIYYEFGLQVRSVDHKGKILNVTSEPFIRCTFDGDKLLNAHIASPTSSYTLNLTK